MAIKKRKLKKRCHTTKRWSDSEDNILLSGLTIKETCDILGRTEKSIKTRIWRLNKRII